MELRTGTVLVAADTTHPSGNYANRRLTVVDQETGRTAELDVHENVNGELDPLLHNLAVLRCEYGRFWPRDAKGAPPRTRVVVVGGFKVDRDSGELTAAA
jgi:hypothetical protein